MTLASGGLRLRPYIPLVLGAGAAVCLTIAAYRSGLRRRQKQQHQSASMSEALLRLLRDSVGQSDMPVLCEFGDVSCHLVVKNRRQVLEKLQTMIREGVNNLEVITDFDHTLSKFEHNGRRVPSCHGILESYPHLSPEDHKYFRDLYAKYYAIEICPNMTEEEKVPRMIEWWSRSHDRMVQAGFQKAVLARTVDMSGMALRDGWRQFFDLVVRHGIPCLIFSAGIGDIIQEIMLQFNITGKLIRVVSNFMMYNSNDILCGFSEPLIHTFNKRFSAFARPGSASATGGSDGVRRNVLLMGDTTGDLRMAEGSHADLVLTVGYLNDKIDARLPVYADSFDIVCLSDPTLSVPLAVLEAVTGGRSCI